MGDFGLDEKEVDQVFSQLHQEEQTLSSEHLRIENKTESDQEEQRLSSEHLRAENKTESDQEEQTLSPEHLRIESKTESDQKEQRKLNEFEKPKENLQKIGSSSLGIKNKISFSKNYEEERLSSKQEEIQKREKELYLKDLPSKESKEFLEWLKEKQREVGEMIEIETNQKTFFGEWLEEMIGRIEENIDGDQIFFDLRKLLFFIKCGVETQQNLDGKEIVLFLGQSGAGKSTTIHYLHGIKMIKKQIETFVQRGNKTLKATKEVIEGEKILEEFKIGHEMKSETR